MKTVLGLTGTAVLIVWMLSFAEKGSPSPEMELLTEEPASSTQEVELPEVEESAPLPEATPAARPAPASEIRKPQSETPERTLSNQKAKPEETPPVSSLEEKKAEAPMRQKPPGVVRETSFTKDASAPEEVLSEEVEHFPWESPEPEEAVMAPPEIVVPPPPPRREEGRRSAKKASPVRRSSPTGFSSEAREIILPEGTPLQIRLAESISTERSQTGDTFRALLDQAVILDGETLFPEGSRVEGRLVLVEEPGKVKGKALLTFELERLFREEEAYSIRTNEISMEAEGSKGKDAAKIGIGAAIGTTLGAIFGGKKGAAIGGAAGAGAGTAEVLLSRGKQVVLEKERLFSFRLEEDLHLARR